MAFWSSETMWDEIPRLRIVDPYDKESVKHGAYELCLGSEAYKTAKDISLKETLGPNGTFDIPPGQFALLITGEKIQIPNSVMGFISIKSSLKVRGLVNVSGFHVDPGFSGQLHFAVYNAGSQNIVLTVGDPLFLLWLCLLDKPTEDLYDGKHKNQTGITSEEIMRIQGEVASPASLKKELDVLKGEVERKLGDLKSETDGKIHKLSHTVEVFRGIAVAVGIALALLLLKAILENTATPRTPAAPAPIHSPAAKP